MDSREEAIARDLSARVRALLEEHNPATTDPRDFLGARFDAGLAWVHFPRGLRRARTRQQIFRAQIDAQLIAARPRLRRAVSKENIVGMGMAAPTIAAFGTEEQKRKYLRSLLHRRPDLLPVVQRARRPGRIWPSVATRAVRDGEDWIINGQKVWTSMAQQAQMAILIARTDPTVPKHKGLTYFLCDMTLGGIDVRPLRQITGEAEFNEVFLTDVRVPDANRLGPEGGGWKVATSRSTTSGLPSAPGPACPGRAG